MLKYKDIEKGENMKKSKIATEVMDRIPKILPIDEESQKILEYFLNKGLESVLHGHPFEIERTRNEIIITDLETKCVYLLRPNLSADLKTGDIVGYEISPEESIAFIITMKEEAVISEIMKKEGNDTTEEYYIIHKTSPAPVFAYEINKCKDGEKTKECSYQMTNMGAKQGEFELFEVEDKLKTQETSLIKRIVDAIKLSNARRIRTSATQLTDFYDYLDDIFEILEKEPARQNGTSRKRVKEEN